MEQKGFVELRAGIPDAKRLDLAALRKERAYQLRKEAVLAIRQQNGCTVADATIQVEKWALERNGGVLPDSLQNDLRRIRSDVR